MRTRFIVIVLVSEIREIRLNNNKKIYDFMQDRENAHQVQIIHKKCSQEKARNAV